MAVSLDPPKARIQIRRILAGGEVSFTKLALDELAADGLTTQDCVDDSRAGVVEPPELEKGTWRYLLHGGWIWVVAAFRSEKHLVVVTAWRVKR